MTRTCNCGLLKRFLVERFSCSGSRRLFYRRNLTSTERLQSTVEMTTVNGASLVALSGTIVATRLSSAYRLGLVAVALAMLLLPILYIGLIVLAGAGVWWHLTTNSWILSGSGTIWRLIPYAGPAVAGVVLMFFMIKPILAKPAKGQEPIPVLPEAEPRLLAFIEQICGQITAPVPRRVQVDCRVNASAGFMAGRFRLLKRDLLLTIGLPLAAGLSVRELGGVLAHEFGHFAQGGGMRLTAVVLGINAWFGRVVYERDQWDERLDEWGKDVDWRLAVVVLMARGSVWASRRLLAGLMFAGHAMSCFMARQMEYDANSYEIKLAGSVTFARTCARLRELNVGAQVGYNDLREGWQQRRLPSNLPVFSSTGAAGFPRIFSRASEPSPKRQQACSIHILPTSTGSAPPKPLRSPGSSSAATVQRRSSFEISRACAPRPRAIIMRTNLALDIETATLRRHRARHSRRRHTRGAPASRRTVFWRCPQCVSASPLPGW